MDFFSMTPMIPMGTIGPMGLKTPLNAWRLVRIGDFTLIQQNGQRTYGGPPPNWGNRPPPSRDCEVFIGRLPRMCFEDELIPLFLRAGELYEFRLMLDFSGTNRGYGYAHYATPQGALNAIKTLNKYEIRDNHQIGVLKSKNNCRLLFGNIKPGFSKENFETFIRAATDSVLEVVMFTNYNELKKTAYNISVDVEEAFLSRVPRGDSNSQFAIVEYENHKAAAVARRVLIPKYGQNLAIDWAVPPKERKKISFDNFECPNARAIQGIKNETKLLTARNSSKPRPVPILMTEVSIMDNVPFLPNDFSDVVVYFKFILKAALCGSIDRLEISKQISAEIEKKIVDRITNLENCGQAVQLILNYLAWYNEKKTNVINPEMQKVLEDVKFFSDAFVTFVTEKFKTTYVPNPLIEEYYTNILPRQLIMIFKFALYASGEEKVKFSGQIRKSLQWFAALVKKGEQGDLETLITLDKINRQKITDDILQFHGIIRPVESKPGEKLANSRPNFINGNDVFENKENYHQILPNRENYQILQNKENYQVLQNKENYQILQSNPVPVPVRNENYRMIVAKDNSRFYLMGNPNGNVYVATQEELEATKRQILNNQAYLKGPAPISILRTCNSLDHDGKNLHSPDSGIGMDFPTAFQQPNYLTAN